MSNCNPKTLEVHTCVFNGNEIKTTDGKSIVCVPLEFKSRKEMRIFFQKRSLVYCWQNIQNNKIYIGSSVTFWRRFLSYSQNLILKTTERVNKKLLNSTKKYGFQGFRLCILELIDSDKSREFVRDREQWYLDNFLPHHEGIGYNFYGTAILTDDAIMSLKSRKSISKSHSGENSVLARLNNKSVLDIKKKLISGSLLKELSLEYGVTTTVISNIKRGLTWKDIKLTDEEELQLKVMSDSKKHKFSEDLIKDIKRDFANGMRSFEIAKKYNLIYSTVHSIKNGHIYGYINP